MSFIIEVQGGSSVRLPTAGKYCDRDIIVTATGGGAADPVIEALEITEDGTYTAPDGVDGYSPITVNVAGSGQTEPDPSQLYQRVEYIESTIDCKIVTDIIADNNTGMELVASYHTLADRVPMGSRADTGTTRFYVPYPLSSSSMYHGFNAGKSTSATIKVDEIYRSRLNFLNDRISSSKAEVANTAKHAATLTETLTQQTCPIGIFCYLRGAEMDVVSSREIVFYSARISQGHEIVREYIPCYRKSDGEVGLYEKFTGEFLANEGSGTFTKGADVAWDAAA